MKWDDVKDSSELAEALSLAASLLAAAIALRDAQKQYKKGDDESLEVADESQSSEPLSDTDLTPLKKLAVKSNMPSVVLVLSIVVGLQMLILLFIAWKVL